MRRRITINTPDAKPETRPPARMRDVAQLAGVGTMTVSRVLSGSLRKARTRSIGIIVPNFYDSFFARCAHEIATVAQERGYSVSVTTSGEDAAAEHTEASLMMRRNVDGIVVIPAFKGESQLMKPEFASIPVVSLDRPIQLNATPSGPNLSSVVVENRKGAERGVQHLIEHGHSRILFLSLSHELYTQKERHAGYVQAMKKAGLEPEACFTCGTQESTLEHLRGLREAKEQPCDPAHAARAGGAAAERAEQGCGGGLRRPGDVRHLPAAAYGAPAANRGAGPHRRGDSLRPARAVGAFDPFARLDLFVQQQARCGAAGGAGGAAVVRLRLSCIFMRGSSAYAEYPSISPVRV
jgi:LacI family transcriptional regulator